MIFHWRIFHGEMFDREIFDEFSGIGVRISVQDYKSLRVAGRICALPG